MRRASAIQLARQCRMDESAVLVGVASQVGPRAEHDSCVRILVMGSTAQFRLRYFYSRSSVRGWVARYVGGNADEILLSQTDDFIREFSNLHGGFIRTVFERTGANFGISLPMIVPTNFARSRNEDQEEYVGDWTLTIDGVTLGCVIEISVGNPARFEELSMKAKPLEDEEIDRIRNASGVEFFDE